MQFPSLPYTIRSTETFRVLPGRRVCSFSSPLFNLIEIFSVFQTLIERHQRLAQVHFAVLNNRHQIRGRAHQPLSKQLFIFWRVAFIAFS